MDAFGARREAVLARGRAAAEALFDATCKITRLSADRGAMDPVTLKYAAQTGETIYEGACKLQDASDRPAGDAPQDAGQRAQRTGTTRLDLPVLASGEVAVNDVVKILANDPDPSVVGRVYTVAGRHDKTHATARRLPIVEVTG